MRGDPRAPDPAPAVVSALLGFGVMLSAVWGFAEATLFFIVPDVIVGFVGLHHPRKALVAGAAAVGGACVGGALLYVVGRQVGGDLRGVMDAVFAIEPTMLDLAHDQLLDSGGLAIVNAPSQGIPYKLYAAEWSLLGWGLPSLVLWTIPARAIRIVGFGLLMAIVGKVLRSRIERRSSAWSLAYVAAWAVFYTYFWFVLMPSRFG